MSNFKGTLGPWHIIEGNHVWGSPPLRKICEVSRIEEYRHNAQAISAVPDMIEALELFVHSLEDGGIKEGVDSYDKAMAALTKAGVL